MRLIAKWFISAFALLGADWLIDGIFIESFGTALLIAIFLGFVNAVLRPVLIFLTLPITVLTLGFFIFVINGILFYFLSWIVGDGFVIEGLGSAMLGALTVSVFSWIGNRMFIEEKKVNQKKAYASNTQYKINQEKVKIYDKKD